MKKETDLCVALADASTNALYHATLYNDLVNAADNSMYIAKNRGRDQIVLNPS